LPRLYFPQQPGGQGLAPAPGGQGLAPAPGGQGPAPAPGGHGQAPAPGGQGPAPAPGGHGPAPAPGGYQPPAQWGGQAPPPPAPPGASPARAPRWSGPRHGGSGPGRAAPPPGPPRPTRPADPALRQRALTAVLLGVLGILAWFGVSTDNVRRGVFLIIFSLVLGLAACWLGVTAMQRARRAGSVRPVSSVLGTVFGCIAAGFSAWILIWLAVFWQQVNAYSECMNSASTVTAQQVCQNQMRQSTGINIFDGGQ
jgi:hypothetical protein